MPKSHVHLVIGTPCYGGQVTSVFVSSLLRFQNVCSQRTGIDLTVLLLSGDALITRARQNIVAEFLENEKATHLLFIDGDIGFEPEQVFRLLDFEAEMTAAFYPTKRIDWDKVKAAAVKGETPIEKAALSYVMEFEELQKAGYRDGFAKVRCVGTGFLLIRREALLKMTEHYPELRYNRENQAEDRLRDSRWRFALFNCMIDPSTGVYLSEDFSFCRRWTDMGGEIWADLQSRLTHVGAMNFVGDAASQFPARK